MALYMAQFAYTAEAWAALAKNRQDRSSRFLRSSFYDSFERCCEELCFLFGQPVRELLSYSPGINWPGVPSRCNPFLVELVST